MRRFVRFLPALIACALASCSGGGGSSPASLQSVGGGGKSGGQGGGGPEPTPAPPSGAAPAVPASGTIYLGAFVHTGNGGDAADIAGLESQIGRRLALSLHYHGWTTTFPGGDERADAAAGRIPVISWNCGTSDAKVAAGIEDANIKSHADALRGFGKPVFLRYKWEMNRAGKGDGRQQCKNPATDTPEGYSSPTDFVAAWNHIRAIFVARGANNVAFLWNPSGESPNLSAPYYPGDASVDWVGIDEYDRSDKPFQNTYKLYSQVIAYHKPIVIAETAANPEYQTTFLAAAASALETVYPEVKGYIYFDAPGHFSWTLTPAGVTAFAAMGRDQYLSAP